MRILVLDRSPIWLNSLPLGFRDLGHDVRATGPITEEGLIAGITEFKPHLALSIGWGSEHTKAKQDLIREVTGQHRVPVAYWATEDAHFAQSFTLPLLMRMKPDIVFTISQPMVEFYQKLGFPAAYLDFGFHPSVQRRMADASSRYPLALVANAYPQVLADSPYHYRNLSLRNLIKPLIQRQQSLHIWGRNWDEMEQWLGQPIPSELLHEHVHYLEAYRVYNESDIVIGPQNYTNQLTQRTYEVLAAGGLLLTSDTEAVRKSFTPDRDLLVSGSPEETLEKAAYYSRHPEEREQIRRQGYESVQKHSYRHRAVEAEAVLQKEGIVAVAR